jgi:hypothetical protein
MTTPANTGTVTDSGVRNPSPTPVEPAQPLPENPRMRRAHAREATSKNSVTDGDDAKVAERPPATARRRLTAATETARVALSGWWAWAAQPPSLAETWQQSSIVDPARMPRRRPWWLPLLWRTSNCTDRLVLFAVILIASAVLQGPLRWAVARPTRRLGLYLLVAVLWLVLAGAGQSPANGGGSRWPWWKSCGQSPQQSEPRTRIPVARTAA